MSSLPDEKPGHLTEGPGSFHSSLFRNTPAGSVSRCLPGTFLDRDAPPVFVEPLLERLHRGVERPGEFKASGSAEIRFEVPVELEHVSQILRPRESEAAVGLGGHAVIPNLLPQRLGKRGRHLNARQVTAGDTDGPADEFAAFPENRIRAFSN